MLLGLAVDIARYRQAEHDLHVPLLNRPALLVRLSRLRSSDSTTETVSRGKVTKMKKIVYGLGGVVALITTAVVAPSASASDGQQIESLIPAFERAQTPADRVPSTVDLFALGIYDDSTVRALGSDESADYWVARSGSSDVCLITHIAGGNEIAASTCVGVSSFYEAGLGIAAGDELPGHEKTAEGYLLPADVNLGRATDRTSGIRSSAADPNFLIADEAMEPATFEREDGSLFEFAPIPPRA